MTKMQEDIKLEYDRKIRLERENREKEEIEKKRKNDIQRQIINNTETINNKIKEQTRQIEEYIKLFSNNHGRFPLKDEIHNGLNGKIDSEILTNYLTGYKTESIHFEIDEEDMV
jgi:sugar-specific transcriptional regulator TrmB